MTKYCLEKNFEKELNPKNPLGHEGKIAKAYARLVNHLWI
jgi:hypothetical protein